MYSPSPSQPPGPTSIRQITLAENFSLAFNTNGVYKNAVILGDVDNDIHGDVEFVVGNLSGEIGVFKAQRKRPWKKCAGLGSIVCLAVGDLANTGKNLLVVISAEGSCHIFDVPPDEQDAPLPDARKNPTDQSNKLKKSDPSNLIGSQAIPVPATVAEKESAAASSLAISSTPLTSVGRTGSIDSNHPPSVLDNPPETAESQAQSGAVPKSATKASKTGNLSFYSSIQTEKLAALASARQGPGQTAQPPQTPNLSGTAGAMADKAPRSETTSGIATSLLDQFKRVATPSNSRPDSPAPIEPEPSQKQLKTSDSIGKSSGSWKKSTDKMEPTFRFFVEPNANCAIIGDLDEDGKNELIIGSNNRAIYAYELVQNDSDAAAQPYLLKLKARWHLASQVTSLCLTTDRWGRPVLLGGLTGGTYSMIDHSQELCYKQISASGSSSHKSHIRDDRTGPAEIITTRQKVVNEDGSIQMKNFVVMSSLEGLMRTQDAEAVTAPPGQKSSTKTPLAWELGLENQLFATRSLDVTGDGAEELVVGTLDGTTYILDKNRHAVKFRFEDRCRAFAAGNYAVAPGKMRPCLFFVTYNDEIIVYHKLGIRSVPIPSLYSVTKTEIENSKIASTLGVSSRKDLTSLLSAVIYDNLCDENVLLDYRRRLIEEKQKLLQEATANTQQKNDS